MPLVLLAALLAQVPDAGAQQGELSRDEIFSVIKRGGADVQRCYDRAIRLPGGCDELDWKVVASWTIERDGSVVRVNIENHSKFEVLGDCIRDVIKRWRFPKPRGGAVNVTFPWLPKIGCEK